MLHVVGEGREVEKISKCYDNNKLDRRHVNNSQNLGHKNNIMWGIHQHIIFVCKVF